MYVAQLDSEDFDHALFVLYVLQHVLQISSYNSTLKY